MLIQIITHTPLWVFGLFALLVMLGYKQSKTRLVKPKLSLILPIVMFSLALQGMVTNFSEPKLALAVWIFSGLITFGLFMKFQGNVENSFYQKDKGLVEVKGSWSPLLLIMTLFFLKYALTVSAVLALPFISQFSFIIVVSLTFGFLNGYSLLRTWNVFNARVIHKVVTS